MPNGTVRIAALFASAAVLAMSSQAVIANPVNLKILTGFTGPDRPAYETLVKQFNAEHPDIQVTFDIQPWDSIIQSLPAAWAAGQGPDIATPSYDPNAIFEYIKNGSALPLDAVPTDAFPAAVNAAFQSGGKTYAVPANMADMALFYDKALLTAAGVAPPKTMEEFQAAAKALTVKGSQYGFVLPDNGFTLAWTILQWSNGGDIVDAKGCSVLQSPENVETFTAWQKLVVDDGVSPAGLDAPAAENLFASKKAAFVVGGPWLVQGFKSAGVDFGISEMPVGKAGPQNAISTVPFMVSAKSAHPKEAQEFLAWWTSKDAQTEFVKDSGFPPVRTDMGAAADEFLQPFQNGLSYGRLVMPGLASASQVSSDAYVPLLGQVMRGQDVGASLTNATKAINSITGCSG